MGDGLLTRDLRPCPGGSLIGSQLFPPAQRSTGRRGTPRTSWRARVGADGTGGPNGSTASLRADVLTALGVFKVVTADQLQRLLRPQAASNKAVRQALGDLQLRGLVASDGNTADSTAHSMPCSASCAS